MNEILPTPHNRDLHHLKALVVQLKGALSRYASQKEGGKTSEPLSETARQATAMGRLVRAFDLSEFERDVLVLCAGMELEPDFPKLCGLAGGRDYPTFALALAVLKQTEEDHLALRPSAPLRRWRLLEVEPERSQQALAVQPLRLAEGVLHYLVGAGESPGELEPRLSGAFPLLADRETLSPSQEHLVKRLEAVWAEGSRPPLQLMGETGSLRAVAAVACRGLGLGLLNLPLEPLLPERSDPLDLAARMSREAHLRRSAWLLEVGDRPEPHLHNRLLVLVDRLGHLETPLLISGRERLGLPTVALTLEVGKPTPDEQRVLWQVLLAPSLENLGVLEETVEKLVTQFDLGYEPIRAAAQEALSELHYRAQSDIRIEARDFLGVLWQACRTQSRTRLDRVVAAQRLEAKFRREDLILSERVKKSLDEIVAQVRYRHLVYDRQGFKASERGRGVAVLFSGPSGTGKTTAAEVLAGELELDLYRVDLSMLVSKYIGETEKNLREVFDAAEDGGSVLLFDEADAIFGKRSDVQDSHDRYANLEVSYLLQRMEQYRGLAILTTNLENAMDEAFIRRLKFIVRFEKPKPPEREEIWRRAIPKEFHGSLDFARLSRLEVTGGNISNIALQAAFKAAGENVPMGMRHLKEAASEELAKLKRLRPKELEDWA